MKAINIANTRKFLKARLRNDPTAFYGFEKERAQLKDLFSRTANEGESNSALLTSSKQGGKTALIDSVLFELFQDEAFVSKTMIILLNGFIHTDDRQALKSITAQMNLDKEVEGRVFNSFSENLTFLLSCLKSGQDAQRLIFIIEEFDLFCAHQNQTLLYNLFDVAQSAQTPLCVLGVTSRLDVVELLEKRVKSRFSHRQISLWPMSTDFDDYMELFVKLLRIPTVKELAKLEKRTQKVLKNALHTPLFQQLTRRQSFDFTEKSITEWNDHIARLPHNEKFRKSLEDHHILRPTVSALKFLVFQIVSRLDETHKKVQADEVSQLINSLLTKDDKVELITGLSVLEICLVIAIKHHCDIYDNDPFNFEMIFTRFTKFSIKSSTMQNIDREIALKKFENLRHQELIAPFGATGRLQKEYQMYKLALLPNQIDKGIHKYQNLPTEVEQWARSSII